MHRILFLSATLLVAGISPRAANAAEFDFNYSSFGGGSVGPGDISGSFDLGAAGKLLSISGTTGNFGDITSLSTYLGADNTLSPPDYIPSLAGISFSTADGVDINLFLLASNLVGADLSVGGNDSFSGWWTVTPVAVPEPASAMLLGMGIIGLIAFAPRHLRKTDRRAA